VLPHLHPRPAPACPRAGAEQPAAVLPAPSTPKGAPWSPPPTGQRCRDLLPGRGAATQQVVVRVLVCLCMCVCVCTEAGGWCKIRVDIPSHELAGLSLHQPPTNCSLMQLLAGLWAQPTPAAHPPGREASAGAVPAPCAAAPVDPAHEAGVWLVGCGRVWCGVVLEWGGVRCNPSLCPNQTQPPPPACCPRALPQVDVPSCLDIVPTEFVPKMEQQLSRLVRMKPFAGAEVPDYPLTAGSSSLPLERDMHKGEASRHNSLGNSLGLWPGSLVLRSLAAP